jgi:hypothetical protein
MFLPSCDPYFPLQFAAAHGLALRITSSYASIVVLTNFMNLPIDVKPTPQPNIELSPDTHPVLLPPTISLYHNTDD